MCEPVKFGDLVTADHKIVAERDAEKESHSYDKVARCMHDYHAKWIDACPAVSKETDENEVSMIQLYGIGVKPVALYSDNASEITGAVRRLGGSAATCTPHIPQTNGVAENTVKKVTEGTACALEQSALSYRWWSNAMRCYTYLRNISDITAHGTRPYQKRFGIPFTGKRIPFGAAIGYLNLGNNIKVVRGHPFGSKTFRGIFNVYVLRTGGSWSGDFYVIHQSTLHHADSLYSVPILRVKDIIVLEYFTFPAASGICKQPEDKRDIFSLEQAPDGSFFEPAIRDADDLNVLSDIDDEELFGDTESDAESGGSRPREWGPILPKRDFRSMDGDFLTRHHVIPRYHMYMPDVSCPFPNKWIDVHRITSTAILDAKFNCIEDY